MSRLSDRMEHKAITPGENQALTGPFLDDEDDDAVEQDT